MVNWFRVFNLNTRLPIKKQLLNNKRLQYLKNPMSNIKYTHTILKYLDFKIVATSIQLQLTLNKNFNPGIFQSQQKTIDSLMNDS